MLTISPILRPTKSNCNCWIDVAARDMSNALCHCCDRKSKRKRKSHNICPLISHSHVVLSGPTRKEHQNHSSNHFSQQLENDSFIFDFFKSKSWKPINTHDEFLEVLLILKLITLSM